MQYVVQGKKNKWEVILGLEVHAQISSKSKLFSVASTDWGGEPNSQVELVDSGMPGALPVINEYCVDQAVLTGLSLNAKINKVSFKKLTDSCLVTSQDNPKEGQETKC